MPKPIGFGAWDDEDWDDREEILEELSELFGSCVRRIMGPDEDGVVDIILHKGCTLTWDKIEELTDMGYEISEISVHRGGVLRISVWRG